MALPKHLQELSLVYSDAAAASFWTCEKHGQYSTPHLIMMANARALARRYEAACEAAGEAPYATYDAD